MLSWSRSLLILCSTAWKRACLRGCDHGVSAVLPRGFRQSEAVFVAGPRQGDSDARGQVAPSGICGRLLDVERRANDEPALRELVVVVENLANAHAELADL